MKEQAITKINKIGKVGNVLTIIARIVIGIALVCSVIGTIVSFAIPEDFMTFDLNGTGDINVNLASVGITLSDQDQKELVKSFDSGSVSFFATDGMMNQLEVSDVDASKDGFVMHADGEMATFSLRNVSFALIAATLYIIMTMVTLFFISGVCKAFQTCETPFGENVIKKMKQLAFSLIPWVVLSSIKDTLYSGMFTNQFNFTASINLDTVFVILIIFGLTYIFQYGAILQQESDETL